MFDGTQYSPNVQEYFSYGTRRLVVKVLHLIYTHDMKQLQQ